MRSTALTTTSLAATTLFSIGVLASIITLVIERWLSSANPSTRYENIAS